MRELCVPGSTKAGIAIELLFQFCYRRPAGRLESRACSGFPDVPQRHCSLGHCGEALELRFLVAKLDVAEEG